MHTPQFIYDSSDGLPLTPGAVTASASSGTATLTFSFAGDRGVPLTHYQVRQYSPCSSDNITIIQTVGAPSAVIPVRQCVPATSLPLTHNQTPLCFCPPTGEWHCDLVLARPEQRPLLLLPSHGTEHGRVVWVVTSLQLCHAQVLLARHYHWLLRGRRCPAAHHCLHRGPHSLLCSLLL